MKFYFTLFKSYWDILLLFYGCWQKTGDSLVRDKELYCITASSMNIKSCITFPRSLVPWGWQTEDWLMHEWRGCISEPKEHWVWGNLLFLQLAASKANIYLIPQNYLWAHSPENWPRWKSSHSLEIFASHMTCKSMRNTWRSVYFNMSSWKQ